MFLPLQLIPTTNKETFNKDTSNKNTSNKDNSNKDTSNKDTSNKDTSNKESFNKDTSIKVYDTLLQWNLDYLNFTLIIWCIIIIIIINILITWYYNSIGNCLDHSLFSILIVGQRKCANNNFSVYDCMDLIIRFPYPLTY